jgi:uncharacterized protein (TIRG00374 family)
MMRAWINMKTIFKTVLLFLPLLYSLLKLKGDPRFYTVFILVYSLLAGFSFFSRNKKYSGILLQIGVSYIFLDLSFHNVDFRLFFKSFRSIDPRFFFLVLVTTFVSLYIRAFKWKYLLHHIRPVHVMSLFKTILVGFMVNAIFPARLGEVYRAYMLSRLERLSKSTVFATVVLERVFDGLVIGLGLVYIFLLNIIHQKLFYKAGFIGIGFYILAILLLLVFYFSKKPVIRLISRVLFFLSRELKAKLFSLLDLFYEGLHIFRHFPNLLVFIFFTIVTWSVITANTYFYLASMNMFPLLHGFCSPVLFSLLLTGLLAIGVTIPSGPGAIGPFQASILFCFYLVDPAFLKVHTLEYNQIASFSMYCWVLQVLLQIAAGGAVFLREKMSLKME